MTLYDALSKVKDPRRNEGLRVNLQQMFCMIFISNLCGHFGGRAISRFAKNCEPLFRKKLNLKHKVPSHVTFSDLLNRVDQKELIAAFKAWAKSYVPIKKGQRISGDGKALASTVTNQQKSNENYQAIVSLFCQESGLIYSIEEYKNKEQSEIAVVRSLIKELENKGISIFLDALHTQKKTVKEIVASGNHYVCQVKGNQPSLFKEIQEVMVHQKPLDYFEHYEKDHGRHSYWYVTVFDATQNKKAEEWKNLRRFIHVHKKTIKKGKVSHSNRLYISDLYETSAKSYHRGIRGHWSIENSLHWVKDVIHNEDNNRIVKNNGPVNNAVFSSIAINVHRKNGTWSITDSQIKFGANVKKLFDLFRT